MKHEHKTVINVLMMYVTYLAIVLNELFFKISSYWLNELLSLVISKFYFSIVLRRLCQIELKLWKKQFYREILKHLQK